MKISLMSNFREWYDHIFDDNTDYKSKVWYRYNTKDVGPDKLEQMFLLWQARLRKISIHQLKDIIDMQFPKYVVYQDLRSHNGEDKLLVSIQDDYKPYMDLYATEYIDTSKGKIQSQSYRLLVIGRKSFLVKYESSQDWRSNVGEGESFVVKQGPDLYDPFLSRTSPMYSIDYINHSGYNMCIDFNVAPGVKGLHLEKYISPQDIKDEIKWWFKVQTVENIDSKCWAKILTLQNEFQNFTKELGIYYG